MRRCAAVAAGLVLVAILLSGDTPWRYTLYGLVSPPDFAQDLAAARVFASNQNPYGVGIARAHAELMKVSEDEGYLYFPHPPLLFLALLPIAGLTLAQAAAIWFGVSLGLLFLLAALLAEAYAGPAKAGHYYVRPHGPAKAGHYVRSQGHAEAGHNVDGPVGPSTVLIIFGALFVWPPVQYNLAKGQWSIVVALLLAMFWHFHVRGEHRSAGASLGVASAVKLFPALLGLYLLARAPRAVLWMVTTVAAVLVLPLVWMGPQTIRMFLAQSQANVGYWETFPAVTFSIHGVLARLLVGGQWARPLFEAPLIARGLGTFVAILLVMIATWFTRKQRNDDGREGTHFAAWIALLVLLNPLAMAHTGVILALPIMLIAQALASDHRVWPKVAWTMGVALVSIPGHTLIFSASNPIEPWQGVALIALPMWGTLSLFLAATAVSAAPSTAPLTFPGMAPQAAAVVSR
jgi:Glycosyltransferase family 87